MPGSVARPVGELWRDSAGRLRDWRGRYAAGPAAAKMSAAPKPRPSPPVKKAAAAKMAGGQATKKWRRERPAEPDLARLSDDELLDRFSTLSRAPHLDEEALRQVDAELARREGATDLSKVEDDSPQARRVDDLVSKGWSYHEAYAEAHGQDPATLLRQEMAAMVDAQRAPGETRDRAVRRLYDEVVYQSYLRAEDWARGHLLSPAGRAAGISAITLFSGQRARARKYASEELKRYWDEIEPRQTYTEFRASTLGRTRDTRAAAGMKHQGQGRDFGL